jgi:hypothetical protein
MNSTGLVLDLANPDIGLRHHILLGPIAVDLQSLAAAPTIVGASSGLTMFVIATPSGLNHYSDFAEFVAALTMGLNGAHIVSFNAGGTYDQTGGIFMTNEAVAILR